MYVFILVKTCCVVLPLVPLCRGEAGLLVTPKYGYFRNLLPFGLCCWPFLSTFLPPLPFLDLSSCVNIY